MHRYARIRCAQDDSFHLRRLALGVGFWLVAVISVLTIVILSEAKNPTATRRAPEALRSICPMLQERGPDAESPTPEAQFFIAKPCREK
jgi:hypothetical protein